MHCCKGTPSKVTHLSNWTQHARFKLSQCNSYNPIAFAFIIGLDPNLYSKGKIELNGVTMALYLTYNKNFQENDKTMDFLQFRQRFGAFVRPCAGGLITHLYACTEQWGERFILAVAGDDNNTAMNIFGA
eukprot:844107-Ditylum_brightwellii.AAC.1